MHVLSSLRSADSLDGGIIDNKGRGPSPVEANRVVHCPPDDEEGDRDKPATTAAQQQKQRKSIIASSSPRKRPLLRPSSKRPSAEDADASDAAAAGVLSIDPLPPPADGPSVGETKVQQPRLSRRRRPTSATVPRDTEAASDVVASSVDIKQVRVGFGHMVGMGRIQLGLWGRRNGGPVWRLDIHAIHPAGCA